MVTAAVAARGLGAAAAPTMSSPTLLRSRTREGPPPGGAGADRRRSRTLCPPARWGAWRAHVGLLRRPGLPDPGAGPAAQRADGDPTAAGRGQPRAPPRSATLQGDAGQWWWHYDARDGSRRRAVPGLQRPPARDGARWRCSTCSRPAATTTPPRSLRGLDWLRTHPEVVEELVDDALRRGLAQGRAGASRAKAARKLARRRPRRCDRGWHLPGVDRVMPATRRSTTSAGPTSWAGCSTPGTARPTDRLDAADARGPLQAGPAPHPPDRSALRHAASTP